MSTYQQGNDHHQSWWQIEPKFNLLPSDLMQNLELKLPLSTYSWILAVIFVYLLYINLTYLYAIWLLCKVLDSPVYYQCPWYFYWPGKLCSWELPRRSHNIWFSFDLDFCMLGSNLNKWKTPLSRDTGCALSLGDWCPSGFLTL